MICLALLVFCLIERQVRQALGPDQKMRGLYPDNRAVRPTGRLIFYLKFPPESAAQPRHGLHAPETITPESSR